jgi:hypothetical protein
MGGEGTLRLGLHADRLFVDDKIFTASNLHLLPAKFTPEALCTRETDDSVYFFRKNSVYSNHHMIDFRMGDIVFSSMEKYLFAIKASTYSQKDIYDQIMRLNDPVAILKLGHSIKCDRDDLESRAPELIHGGLRAKFEQNEQLKMKLLATSDKQIVESSPVDGFWVAAADFSDPKLLRKEWTGQNQLGKLLMLVREELRA